MMNPFEERKAFLQRLKTLKEKTRDTQPTNPPENLFVQCPTCSHTHTQQALNEAIRVCPSCGHHFSLGCYYRLKTLLDSGTFREIYSTIKGGNPLGFKGYSEKLAALRAGVGINEAVVCAVGKIDGNKAVFCVMDSRFLMGSMGAAVGEKITLAAEYATQKRLPLIVFCASGGARMQEGIISLFQMAKTCAAIEEHSRAGLLYVSVLTHPTTGGVTASFASIGDIILAEPAALIGFAGPRVIEQTIRQKLPEGFQRSEYLLKHGFVDAVVPRSEMRGTLSKLLSLHKRRA